MNCPIGYLAKSIVIKSLSFIPNCHSPGVKRSHSEAFLDHSDSSSKYNMVDQSISNADEQWETKADQLSVQ